MALTQLKSFPTSDTRLGSVCFDKTGTSTNDAHFLTETAADSALPVLGKGDFLIFGEFDYRSNGTLYHWGQGQATSGNYVSLGVTGSTPKISFAFANNSHYVLVELDGSTVATASTSAGNNAKFIRHNGKVKYFCWRSYNATGASDYWGVGIVAEDGEVYTAETARGSGGSNLTDAEGDWSIASSGLTPGNAGHMTFGTRYQNGAVSGYGSTHGAVTFCKFTSIATSLGYSHADLTAFKAKLKEIAADPVYALSALSTKPTNVWTLGDVYRFGTKLNNRGRALAITDTSAASPGDKLIGTKRTYDGSGNLTATTTWSMKGVGLTGYAQYFTPYSPPVSFGPQPLQNNACGQAQRFGTGYLLSFTGLGNVSASGACYYADIRDANGAPCKQLAHAGTKIRYHLTTDVRTNALYETIYSPASDLNLEGHRGLTFVALDSHITAQPSGHHGFSAINFAGISNYYGVESLVSRTMVTDGQGRAAYTGITLAGTDPYSVAASHATQSGDIAKWTTSYPCGTRVGDVAIFACRTNDTTNGRLLVTQHPSDGTTEPTDQWVTKEPTDTSGLGTGGFPIMTVPLSSTKFLVAWQPRHYTSTNCGYYGPMGFIGTVDALTTNTAWWAARTGNALDGASGRPTLGDVEPQDKRTLIDQSSVSNYSAINTATFTNARNIYTTSGAGYMGTAAFLGNVFAAGTLDDDANSGFGTLSKVMLHTYRYNSATNVMDFVAEFDALPALTAEFGDGFQTTAGASADNQAAHHGWGHIQFTDANRRSAVILWYLDTNTAPGLDRSSLGYVGGRRIAAWYFPDLIGNPTRYQSLGVVFSHPGMSCSPVNFRADDYSTIAFTYVTSAIDASAATRVSGGVQEINLTKAIESAAATLSADTSRDGWLGRTRG